VATLRIPRQSFDSPAQMEFAKKLSYNPWHTIAEHRPLGNQSRARRRMYWELSKLRHDMNAVPHYEPNGDEVFESAASGIGPGRGPYAADGGKSAPG
jgi:hypothetical protein